MFNANTDKISNQFHTSDSDDNVDTNVWQQSQRVCNPADCCQSGPNLADLDIIETEISNPSSNSSSPVKSISNEIPTTTNTAIQSQHYQSSSQPKLVKSFQEQDKNFPLGLYVGIYHKKFNSNLQLLLNKFNIGTFGDFIATPLEPARSPNCESPHQQLLADLSLDKILWTSRIVLTIDHPNNISHSATERFKQSFEHALYLWPMAIIINCPDTEFIILSIVSVINEYIDKKIDSPAILIRVAEPCHRDLNQVIYKPVSNDQQQDTTFDTQECFLDVTNIHNYINDETIDPWTTWNKVRAHLIPYRKIGVCLHIDENFTELSDVNLNRWLGEPIRFLIIETDQFVRSIENHNQLKLNVLVNEFIRKVMRATSFTTAILISGNEDTEDLREYVIYMDQLCSVLQSEKQDSIVQLQVTDLRQSPLQPLSSNLNSFIYNVFEQDVVKYLLYKDAMLKALQQIFDMDSAKVKFNIMVLGAGRGPLVDRFLEIVGGLRGTKKRFTIYVLDKNPSAIVSLKYKKEHLWKQKGSYEIKIVCSDMRSWNPDLKADLIITELLGSFSDNELSPECIHGAWTYATHKTLCIPQRYTSYINPISYYNMYECLTRESKISQHLKPFDRLYVVQMTNYYSIAEPQALFTFEHTDLTLPPETNHKYKRLEFYCETDTVCHGFGGYFSAELFRTVNISIHPETKTPNMNSWFPVFIPLEQPVWLTKGTKLVLHFWRKESPTNVWYEWVVTEPVRSRIHSPNGQCTAMSKIS